ncbi:MAG TPA: tetratricopeptide repeat protein [Planctomycetota bacterium]|nr:tetratricopeptide repeat protein [Planctomycetota bacterium]
MTPKSKRQPRSSKRAIELLRRRAKAGDARAQGDLAVRYATGEGVRRNRRTANALYLSAAMDGDAHSAFNLGCVYRDGLGVERSLDIAYVWFLNAARDGHLESAQEILWLIGAGKIPHPPRPALLCLQRMAHSGNPEAWNDLGVHWFEGKNGWPKNRKAALRCYRRAARQNNVSALFNIGLMYKDGDAVRKSWPNALKHFRRAAALDHERGAHWLARYYNGDEGHPVRDALALKWLRRALDLGDGQSTTNLGIRYHEGQGVPKDLSRAAELYKLGGDRGDPWGKYLLGLCYRDGEGVRKNIRSARKLWTAAATKGIKAAKRQLKRHVPIGAAIIALGAVAAFLILRTRTPGDSFAPGRDPARVAEAERSLQDIPKDLEAPLAKPREAGSARADEPTRREQSEVKALELLVTDPAHVPLENARVVLFRTEDVIAQGSTASDGRLRLREFAGRAEYAIAAPGWGVARGELDLNPGLQTLELTEGAVVGGIMVCQGAPPSESIDIEWTTSGDADRSLPRAVVRALESAHPSRMLATTRTREDGSFEIHGLRPATPGSLSWRGRYYLEAAGQELALDFPQRDLVLRLVEHCELRLRVVNVAGTPLPGASVRVSLKFLGASGDVSMDSDSTTDPEGRFSQIFSSQDRTTVSVSIAPPNSSSERLYQLTPPSVLRGIWDVGDLATAAARTLTVHVVDSAGGSISGAQVDDWPAKPKQRRPTTDEKGRVEYALGPETTSLAVVAFPYEYAIVAVALDATELTAKLESSCMVEFDLPGLEKRREDLTIEMYGAAPMFADGDLARAIRQPAWPSTPRSVSGELSVGKSADRFRVILRGSKDLRVGGLAANQPFQAKLIADGETLCEVEIPPLNPHEQRKLPLVTDLAAKSLLVRVFDPAGAPCPGAQLHKQERGRFREYQADERGEIELESLYGERCNFIVTADKYAPARVCLRPIPAGPFDVHLLPARSVEVELVRPDGAAFEDGVDFTTTFEYSGDPLKTPVSPGRYRLDGLPREDVGLAVEWPDGSIQRFLRDGEKAIRIVIGELGAIDLEVDGMSEGEQSRWTFAVAPARSRLELDRAWFRGIQDGKHVASVQGLAAGS